MNARGGRRADRDSVCHQRSGQSRGDSAERGESGNPVSGSAAYMRVRVARVLTHSIQYYGKQKPAVCATFSSGVFLYYDDVRTRY